MCLLEKGTRAPEGCFDLLRFVVEDAQAALEEAARQEKGFLSRVLRALPDMKALVDKDGIVVDANTAFEDFFGWKRAVRTSLCSVVTSSEESRCKDALSQAFNGHLVNQLHMQSKESVLQWSFALLPHAPLVWASCHDVTVFVRRTEKLVDTKDAAVAARQAKENFVRSVSHELRSPLNSILGYSELMREMGSGRLALQSEFTENIHQCAQHMLSIVNDVLDLEKVEAQKMTLRNNPFHVEQLVELSVQLSYVQAQPGVTCITSVDEEVPTLVVGDSTRVKQILGNFMSNAFKFTRRGFVILRVRRETKAKREWLRFSVQDSGKGISPRQCELLFREFQQVGDEQHEHGQRTQAGSSGLGLFISKGLAHLWGGDVGVNSAEGVGSEFFFTLPLVKAPSSPRIPMRVHTSTAVLIVHSLPTVQQELAATCKKCRVHVLLLASSWADAAAQVEGSAACAEVAKLKVVCDPLFLQRDALAVERLLKAVPSVRVTLIEICEFVTSYKELQVQFMRHNAVCEKLYNPIRSSIFRRFVCGLPANIVTYNSPARQTCSHFCVLVVDDQRINLKLLRRMLERLGCNRVKACQSGEEALNVLVQFEPHVIFCDLTMPSMDGYELGRRIVAKYHRAKKLLPPIVALSGALPTEDRKNRCFQVGMLDYLTKPVTLLDVETKVQIWGKWFLERKRSETALSPVTTPRNVSPLSSSDRSSPSAVVFHSAPLRTRRLHPHAKVEMQRRQLHMSKEHAI